MKNPATKNVSPVFGLQYIEEEDATLLDVVGCQGVVGQKGENSAYAITLRFCGDWDNSDEELPSDEK